MRPEGNPLDLNNLPEDNYTIRDGKLTSEDSSSSAAGGGYSRKKKSGGNKDEAGKVYECRFCSLKFCKSQALGGHMNRHRQERETETLNKARQLVFTNDLAPTPLGFVSSLSNDLTSGQQIPHGGFHQPGNMGGGDPSLPFRSMYPTSTRLFSTSSPFNVPPPQQPSYTSPPRFVSFPNQYPAPPSMNEYLMGHVLSPTDGNYTCVGAPVGHGAGRARASLEESGGSGEDGLNWGRR